MVYDYYFYYLVKYKLDHFYIGYIVGVPMGM